MVLRIGYVREHFSSPLLQFAEKDNGELFTLVECPSGTGQLISRLTSDEIDVAIALTDALIAGIAKGSKAYKLVGSYVSTPLSWAIITGTGSPYNSIADLRDTTMGISRYGSGSQIMAYVMALQEGWAAEDLKFQVENDIDGLLSSVNEGSTSAFMWEWFTTKPFVDAGKARFIGSVPTPWPSWMIAAHPKRAAAASVSTFLTGLTEFVNQFNSEESRETKNVAFIEEKWGYKRDDIQAWLKAVDYPRDCSEIPSKVILDTLSVLTRAGALPQEDRYKIEDFVNMLVARVV